MRTELKPCPFCGGSATIERYGDHRQSTIYQCDNCSCSLETGEEWGHGADWNRRPSPTNLENAERAEMGTFSPPFSYVPMPLDEDDQGPADDVDAVSVDHDVWDANCVTVATCGNEEAARSVAALMNARVEARIRSCLIDKEIDELAYRFWSVHPKELDTWVENDPHPPMPQGYKGGVRAWFFACKMRELICLLDKPEAGEAVNNSGSNGETLEKSCRNDAKSDPENQNIADKATAGEDMLSYYERQIEWSRQTFGPALRTKGVLDHIRKELCEIEQEPHDLSEWVDVVILAMDGFWRHGGNAADLFPALLAKQIKNMARSWPDWRTMSEDKAIEHDRSKDATLTQEPTHE